jgi:hypothetical protein
MARALADDLGTSGTGSDDAKGVVDDAYDGPLGLDGGQLFFRL